MKNILRLLTGYKTPISRTPNSFAPAYRTGRPLRLCALIFLCAFAPLRDLSAQKAIHELPAKTTIDTNYLFIQGNPTTGKLYKTRGAALNAFISGGGGTATDTTSLSNRIDLKLNISDTAGLSNRIDDIRLSPLDSLLLIEGTDITTGLNTLLATGLYSYANIKKINTINGTVTIPDKFELIFVNGGRFIGTGTVNGGIIKSSAINFIFDTTLTINPEGCADGWFSGRWYGANPSIADNQPYLQKSINTCLANGLPNLYLPRGQYSIAKGLLFHRGDNLQTQIHFYGDQKGLNAFSTQTVLNCTHNDNFAIALTAGKDCVFENFAISGVNQLNYSNTTAYTEGTTYLTNGSRDNRYSPYAGIAIDIFHQNVTGSDRYPGFEGYYAAATATGGSTSCIFRNIDINGFTVARVLSPNGVTVNNESHIFEGCWISNCREGYVSCNSQERNVIIKNELIWNSVQTCYSTSVYGALNGDPPFISNINIAGNIYQFIYWPGTGYGPFFTAENIHAESLYRIGYIHGQSKISNSKFHLALVADATAGALSVQPWVLSVGSISQIEFNTCQIYMYNDIAGYPLNISGSGVYSPSRIHFANCWMQVPSIVGGDAYVGEDFAHNAFTYSDTRFYPYDVFSMNTTIMTGIFDYSVSFNGYFIVDVGNEILYGAGSSLGSTKKSYIKHTVTSPIKRLSTYTPYLTITRSGNEAMFNAGGFEVLYQVGDAAMAKDGAGSSRSIGRIKSISGDTVTLDALVNDFVTGSYAFYISYLQRLYRPFIGNTTSGSALITGVNGSGGLGSSARVSSTSNDPVNGVYVTSVSGDTVTLSNTVGHTGTDEIFCSYEYQESGVTFGDPLLVGFPEALVVRKGTRLVNTDQSTGVVEYLCSKSGAFGTANPPTFVPITTDYLLTK